MDLKAGGVGFSDFLIYFLLFLFFPPITSSLLGISMAPSSKALLLGQELMSIGKKKKNQKQYKK